MQHPNDELVKARMAKLHAEAAAERQAKQLRDASGRRPRWNLLNRLRLGTGGRPAAARA